jgi:hypothetical protein
MDHMSNPMFQRIGNELGVDPNVILSTSHGRRSIDVLKLLSPEVRGVKSISHYFNPLNKLSRNSGSIFLDSRS